MAKKKSDPLAPYGALQAKFISQEIVIVAILKTLAHVQPATASRLSLEIGELAKAAHLPQNVDEELQHYAALLKSELKKGAQ